MNAKIYMIVMLSASFVMAINVQNIFIQNFDSALLPWTKNKLEADSVIDAEEKSSLMNIFDVLEEEGQDLYQLDSSCLESVKLRIKSNDDGLLSDECEELYDDLRPKYVKKVKSAASEYYFAHTRGLKKKDEREFVKYCVDNIVEANYLPDYEFEKVKIDVKKTVVERDGYRVDYSLALMGPKKNPQEEWFNRVSEICSDYILESNASERQCNWGVCKTIYYNFTEYALDYIKEKERFYAKNGNEMPLWKIVANKGGTVKQDYDYCRNQEEKMMEKCKKDLSIDYYHYAKGSAREKLDACVKRNVQNCKPSLYEKYGYRNNNADDVFVISKIPNQFFYFLNGNNIFTCSIASGSLLGYIDFPEGRIRFRSGNTPVNNEKAKPLSPIYRPAYLKCDCAGKIIDNKCVGSIHLTDDQYKKGVVGIFFWGGFDSSKNETNGNQKDVCDNPNLTVEEQRKCRVKNGM